MNIIVGTHVWAEDPDVAWIDGEVVEINGGDAKIFRSDGKMVRFLNLYLSFYLLSA